MEFYKQIKLKNGDILTLRNAIEEDCAEFTEFTNKLFKETNFFTRGVGDPDVTEEMQFNYITKHKEANNALLLVAILNNKIVGHAHIDMKSSKIKLRHRSEFGIGILMDYWGKGIGKILTNEIIEFAKQCKYEQIELVVVNSNERAIKLYEIFGFKKFGTFVNSFKYPDGTYDDGIYMIKFLKD